MKAKKLLKDLRKLRNEEDINKVLIGLSIVFLVISVGLLNTGGLVNERNFSTDSIRVIDGDTVEVSANRSNVTVRLLGVDTPETQNENSPEEFGLKDTDSNRQCLRNYGEEAREYVMNLTGSGVSISTDEESVNRGDYGRLLAYIEVDGESVNKALLEKGYARIYESEFSRLKKFRELSKDARSENLGIWRC